MILFLLISISGFLPWHWGGEGGGGVHVYVYFSTERLLVLLNNQKSHFAWKFMKKPLLVTVAHIK